MDVLRTVRGGEVVSEESVRIGHVTLSLKGEELEEVVREAVTKARVNPRVSVWNWRIAFLREFLNIAEPSLRFSRILSEIFEAGLKVTSPELHRILEEVEATDEASGRSMEGTRVASSS